MAQVPLTRKCTLAPRSVGGIRTHRGCTWILAGQGTAPQRAPLLSSSHDCHCCHQTHRGGGWEGRRLCIIGGWGAPPGACVGVSALPGRLPTSQTHVFLSPHCNTVSVQNLPQQLSGERHTGHRHRPRGDQAHRKHLLLTLT